MQHISPRGIGTLAATLMALAIGCSSHIEEAEELEVGSVRQQAVAADVFDCRDESGPERVLCDLVLARVNQELDSRGITIDKSGVLFTYDNPNDIKLSTGHSCTVTAKVIHRHAEARISKETKLEVRGDALRDPFAIHLNVPVALSASARVKQRFGSRFLGSCSNYASDSYTFKGSASTSADVLAAFSLNPSFGKTSEGDLAIMLHPAVTVASQLLDPDINFRVSGVSPITPAWTWVTGFSSTLARATTAAFSGDSVGEVFKTTAAWDFGVPLFLATFGGPAQSILWDLVEQRAELAAQRKAAQFGQGLEESLNKKLRAALRTDAQGVRTFVLDKDYVALLEGGRSLEELLIPTVINARQECHEALAGMCSACRGCSACVRAHQACQSLAQTTITELTPIPTRPDSLNNSGGNSGGAETQPRDECQTDWDCRSGFICDHYVSHANICCEPEDDGTCI